MSEMFRHLEDPAGYAGALPRIIRGKPPGYHAAVRNYCNKVSSGWKVSDGYTDSDHQYISFSFKEERRPDGYNARRRSKWNMQDERRIDQFSN